MRDVGGITRIFISFRESEAKEAAYTEGGGQ